MKIFESLSRLKPVVDSIVNDRGRICFLNADLVEHMLTKSESDYKHFSGMTALYIVFRWELGSDTQWQN